MIIDERMSAFIDSLDSGNPAWLNEIEKFALETQVPIIRRSMQSLLKFLLKFTKPKSILEVGTAIGFSALLMSEYAPEDCHITTIEKYEKRIPIAKENFRKAGREDRITLLEGDATEILRELEGTCDLYGCGEGTVHSFPAGYLTPVAPRRTVDLRQRITGR